MTNFLKKYSSEIVGACICLTAGMLSGYFSHSGDTIWYQTLIKPDFNPPSWVFSPIWTILYIMIGVALGKIWNYRNQNNNLLFLFMMQFMLNLLWSHFFFNMHRIDFALYDIILLLIVISTLLFASRKRSDIFMMLLPYFLWVSFAAVLNFQIYQLNSESNNPSYLELYKTL